MTYCIDADAEARLRQSIEHWKRLEAGKRQTGEYVGYDYCDLCKRFNTILLEQCEDTCGNCPVFIKTNGRLCKESPFYAAQSAFFDYGIDSAEFKAAAKVEREFLESLLPENQPKDA